MRALFVGAAVSEAETARDHPRDPQRDRRAGRSAHGRRPRRRRADRAGGAGDAAGGAGHRPSGQVPRGGRGRRRRRAADAGTASRGWRQRRERFEPIAADVEAAKAYVREFARQADRSPRPHARQRRARGRRSGAGLRDAGADRGGGARRALGGRGRVGLVAPLGAHGVQGRRRALGARHRRGDRGATAARSTPRPATSAPASRCAAWRAACSSAWRWSPTWCCARPSTPADLAAGGRRDRPGDRRGGRHAGRLRVRAGPGRGLRRPAARPAGAGRPRPASRAADPTALEAWRARLYAPDRLVVSAAGAVDEDELLRAGRAAVRRGARPTARRRRRRRAFVGGRAAEARRAGAGAPGLLSAGRRRGRSRLLRHAPVRRGAGRRHVEPALPGGARAAGPGLRHRRLRRELPGDRRASASTPAARPRTPPGWPRWSRAEIQQAGGRRRRGRAGARQGAAEGRPVHGPRIAGRPRRAGRRAAAGVRPAADAARRSPRRSTRSTPEADRAGSARGCWRRS